MRTLLTLTKSSIKMFYRNKQALFFTFFSPLLIMLIFGAIGLDKVQKIDVGLALSVPPTAGTAQFVEALKQVPSFTIHEGIESDLRDQIGNDKLSAVFLIPGDLIPDNPAPLESVLNPGLDTVPAAPAANTSETRTVTVLTNSGQAQQAGIAASIMGEVLDKTALKISGGASLFKLETQEINSNHLKYVDFLLPGLIALSLMQMSVFSTAFVFTNYKEKGILKRLIATPMRPATFVGANVITRLIVSFIQVFTFIIVGVLYLKAHVIGSYWLIALIAIVGSVMFLGLGFTISGFSKTTESVPALANLIVFPMLFLGGTFFPISSFPVWLQHIAKYLPLTYLSDSLRQVMTKAACFGDIRSDLLWMLAWSIILVGTANITFGFEEKRQ
ncbi:MAG: ABC transporter permease [Candidatus Doudnabacteria bacterium]